MAFSSDSRTTFLAALVLVSACVLPTKADIRAVNQCPYALTLFHQHESSARTQLTLASGQSAWLGLPIPWTAGVLWASKNGNANNGEVTQLEFTIDKDGRDYYDISLVNAYNEPTMINPTYVANGAVRGGHECGTIQCTIPDLNAVCHTGNFFAGPDGACINRDGPGTQGATAGTNLFQTACPTAYAFSNQTGVVYGCPTGSNYDAIFCP